jgi:hypothetical protein
VLKAHQLVESVGVHAQVIQPLLGVLIHFEN